MRKISNHFDSILIIVDLFAANSENAVSMIWDVSSTQNVVFRIFESQGNILVSRYNQSNSVNVLEQKAKGIKRTKH